MKNSVNEVNKILLPIKAGNVQNDLEQEFADTVKRKKSALVISPHLDDAVLSMGSLLSFLSEKKFSISVVTVFTQGSDLTSEFINTLVRKGGYGTAHEYFEARRVEDKKALALFGVENVIHLNFVDAAWRMNDNAQSLYKNTVIGVERDEKDQELISSIQDALKNLSIDSDTLVFAPIGRGKHVDHILVRDSATKVFSRPVYYTDFPYSMKHNDDESFQKAQDLSSIVWTDGFYEKKVEAIMCYVTQLESLCGGKSLQLQHETYSFMQGNLV